MPTDNHSNIAVSLDIPTRRCLFSLYDLHVDYALLYYCHVSHPADMVIRPSVKRREFQVKRREFGVMPGNICVILSVVINDGFLCL